ncbi:MAG: hypothetical protein R6X02_27515 [Enhygromyxa sp.]
MAGLPTSGRSCASLGALLLCFAGCEGRSLFPGDEGIDFGDGDLDDGDPDDGDPDDGDPDDGGPGDGDPGDGDDDSPLACFPIVDSLVITDQTPPAAVACIEQVLGDLTVGPTTELVDLQMLSSLRKIGGAAHIAGNLALTSVDGLQGLEQLEWLHLRRNRNLSNLHGLDGLRMVERISVVDNDGMTSLAGLPDDLAPSLLEIADNELLASLDGLPVFASPREGALAVEIDDNPSLIDLGGLSDCCADQALGVTLEGNEELDDLGGLEAFVRLASLRIHDNPALASLGGLDSLVEVGLLEIGFNHCAEEDSGASLVSLAGAPKLAVIDTLQVQWVDSLTSLAGLEGVDTLGVLRIRNNAALPWDAVLELEAQTEPQVVDACGGLGGPECAPEPCPMFSLETRG